MLKEAFFKLHKAVFDSYIWLPASLSGALLEMLNHLGLKRMKFRAGYTPKLGGRKCQLWLWSIKEALEVLCSSHNLWKDRQLGIRLWKPIDFYCMNESILQCRGFYPREQKGNQNTGHLDMEDKFLFVLYLFIYLFIFCFFFCDFPLFCENLTKIFLAVEGIMFE